MEHQLDNIECHPGELKRAMAAVKSELRMQRWLLGIVVILQIAILALVITM